MKFIAPAINKNNNYMKKDRKNEEENRKLLRSKSYPYEQGLDGARTSRKMSISNTPSFSSNRSSGASVGSEFKFKAIVKITRIHGEEKKVYFKQDGARFEAQETLKLQSAVDYLVRMEFSPPLELTLVKLVGIEYSFQLKNDPENDSNSIYEFQWSTHGIDPTLNRHRAEVPCVLKFKAYKEVDFKLQVKFYSDTEGDAKHITWGQQLNSIIMECIVGRGTYTSYVDSVKFI